MRQHEAHSIDFNMHDKLRSAMRPEMQVTITKNADDKSEPVSKLKCFNHSFQLLVWMDICWNRSAFQIEEFIMSYFIIKQIILFMTYVKN